MAQLCLHIDVPMCSFRPFTSRDYQDTYPAPPPATLFGMLLSYLGVEPHQASRFFGNCIGIAIDDFAQPSRVLRKMRRDPANNKKKLGIPQFRPEYQEVLIDLQVYCLVDDQSAEQESLVDALCNAMENPKTIERYGGLSMGESAFLINTLSRCDKPKDCLVLQPDERGTLSMPVWTDFKERTRTRIQRFELVAGSLDSASIVVGETPTQT